MPPPPRQCGRCGRVVEPRGQTPPRFCPVCGERLVPATEPLYSPPAAEPTLPRRTSLQAVAGLVLGILSLVLQPCAFPLGLIAVLLGFSSQRSIEVAAGRLAGRGFATAGIVLGLISTIIWLLVNVFLLPHHHGHFRF